MRRMVVLTGPERTMAHRCPRYRRSRRAMSMPENGWRLLADSMATLQMALLEQGNAARAQEGTQQLFAALQHALPTERYQAALNLSSQALMGWMQARRAATE